MKKNLLILLSVLSFIGLDAQVWNLKSMPASGYITRKEGGSQINIDIRNSMPMNHTMWVRYSLVGKNADAMVNTDLSNISAITDTILFNANDTIRRFSFKAAFDGFTEGNDTFTFKITGVQMGTIGSPDSVRIVITDSTSPTITPRPLYNIGTIRGGNKNGIPDSVGIACTIRGTLYGVNRRTTGYEMYICDGTGCIGMFSSKTYSIYTNAKEGDSVEISGYVDEYNGWGEIKFSALGDTIRLLGTGNLKAPTVVTTALNEATESMLIKVEGLTLNSGKWMPDSNFNLTMRNSTGTEFTVRVLNKSNVFSSIESVKTGDIYSITGIGSQFDAATNKTTGYQLYPRKIADIVKTGTSTGSITTNQSQDWTVFPTVITNFMYIAYNAPSKGIADINIVDMQGKVVKSLKLALNAGEQVYTLDNLNDLPKGNYILDFTTNQARLNKIFSVAK